MGGATGAALMGLRPVAEMQFADFISCAWDRLVTVAAKQFFRGRTPVPIVVRLPSGGGFSGGPFHSQNPESSFAHIPGLKIVCPATTRRKGLLATSIEDRTRFYFEHKHLYRRIKGEVPEERYTVPFGQARVPARRRRRRRRDVGRHGAHGLRRGRPACGRGFEIEILDLRTLVAQDKARARERQALLEGARPPRGHAHGQLRRRDRRDDRRGGVRDLDAPVMRIAAPDTPVPFSPALEKAFLPQVEDVAKAPARARRVLMVRRPKSAIARFRSRRNPEGVRFAARCRSRFRCRRPRRRIVDRNPDRGRDAADGRVRLEGTITKWLKQPGEPVARDEPLLEISTDKVDTEVPSPGEGVLAEIIVPEGQTVEVGTSVLARGPAGRSRQRRRHRLP